MPEICVSDLRRIIKYLEDAAALYGSYPAQRYQSRRYYLLRCSSKLNKKLRNMKPT